MLNRRLNPLCLLLFVCSLFPGCGGGDGPKLVQAGGVVTYKGKPIERINVMLMPGTGGMIAEGTTDASGKFKLQTKEPGDGAMVGSYKVAFNFVPVEPVDMYATTATTVHPSPIPHKYGDAGSSGYTATVDPDKSKNNFTFDLK